MFDLLTHKNAKITAYHNIVKFTQTLLLTDDTQHLLNPQKNKYRVTHCVTGLFISSQTLAGFPRKFIASKISHTLSLLRNICSISPLPISDH